MKTELHKNNILFLLKKSAKS